MITIPSASHAPNAAANSSASALLAAMILCFRLDALNMWLSMSTPQTLHDVLVPSSLAHSE